MNLSNFRNSVFLLFLIGSVHFAGSPEKTNFPFKIGLVADSQITTQNGAFDSGMREKIADKLVDVAIRPVAVELYSGQILDALLHKMTTSPSKPELILYLGDAANSGCRDEIDAAFEILEKYQAAGNPIFFVIGNHDYLGAGNTQKDNPRQKLCENKLQGLPDPNKLDKNEQETPSVYLTKYQLIEKVSAFNRASKKHLGDEFEFSDNFDEVTAVYKTLGSDCDDHKRYFLSGFINYKSRSTGKKAEIVLADTSDYTDSFSLSIGLGKCNKGYGFWGAKGSISHKIRKNKDPLLPKHMLPQIEYVASRFGKGEDAPDYRLIASHYPPNSLHSLGSIPGFSRFMPFRKKLRKWWLEGRPNYWLYGHTHLQTPKFLSIRVNSNNTYGGFNVGSTTDAEPHVVILKDFPPVSDGESGSGSQTDKFEMITLAKDLDNSTKVLRKDLDQDWADRIASDGYKPNCKVSENGISGMTLLGLDKSYRSRCWRIQSVAFTKYNLEKYITSMIGTERENGKAKWKKDELIKALFLIATRDEKGIEPEAAK